MTDVSNTTKIEYTLHSPDSIILTGTTKAYVTNKNGKQKPAKTVLYEKSVGEKAYYTVQTVADIKARTLYTLLAFIGEKKAQKGALQSTDTNSPSATPEAEFAKAPNGRIAQREQNVNQKHNQELETVEELKQQNELQWRQSTKKAEPVESRNRDNKRGAA